MSESATYLPILTREARPWNELQQCVECGAKCHSPILLGEPRCRRCRKRQEWKMNGEPDELVTRQAFNQGNAAARAEKIRERTRDRKQQEAMLAAERAMQQAERIVEEPFDPARSEVVIQRFAQRARRAPFAASPPMTDALPVADAAPLTEPVTEPVFAPRILSLDDPSLHTVSRRWRDRVAAQRAALGAD